MKRLFARETTSSGVFQFALLPFYAAVIVSVAACRSGPPPAEYVLGTIPAGIAAAVPETESPVIEIRRVEVPDYLDTTDILERKGNELIPSSTGRWGERLSIGLTRALTASLAARLPRMVVTAAPPVGRPARQVLVDVAAFEARTDRQVVLVARWTIVNGTTRQRLVAEKTSLVETIAGTDDASIVAGMSDAVEDLARQIAAGIAINIPSG